MIQRQNDTPMSPMLQHAGNTITRQSWFHTSQTRYVWFRTISTNLNYIRSAAERYAHNDDVSYDPIHDEGEKPGHLVFLVKVGKEYHCGLATAFLNDSDYHTVCRNDGMLIIVVIITISVQSREAFKAGNTGEGQLRNRCIFCAVNHSPRLRSVTGGCSR